MAQNGAVFASGTFCRVIVAVEVNKKSKMDVEFESGVNNSETGDMQELSRESSAVQDDEKGAGCAVKSPNAAGDHDSFTLTALGTVLKCGKRDEVLNRLAHSDAHFKHQQLGDPDLTVEEKVQIAVEILDKSPINFLRRFHAHLTLQDIDYFDDLKGDYEVDFYLKEIRDRHDKSKSEAKVKNRRFMALRKLTADGEYFSEEEMKWRDPLLYEEMVGRFLTEDDVKEKVEGVDLTFSSLLLKHYDQIQENALYHAMKEREDDQKEEGDSDSEEEEEKEEEDMDGLEESADQPEPGITAAEKLQLFAEFRQTMEMRFLSGQDKDFDYSEVDENTAYDDLDALDEAAQDKYFDED